MYEPPEIFSTDDYFQQRSLAPTVNECSINAVNGTVASCHNSSVSSDMPLDQHASLEPQPEIDIHTWTQISHTNKDGTDASIAISDAQPLNDNS